MVLTSLKPTEQIFLFPPEFIPKPVEWDNYAEAWSQGEFWTYTQNSTLVAALNIAGNIFGSSLPAFAFARLRFTGRRVLFLIMLSTMMVPIWVTIVPTFLLFKFFGWNGTLLPLIVPGFFAVPFYTFLLRQYFLGISHELEDAARMDGANSLTIYFRIVMPLARPALATVAIFAFVYHWNDLITPLIYLTDEKLFTVALGLSRFRNSYRMEMSHMMAAATFALVPVLIIYFFTQRLFIQGIVLSGSKG
ncbi:MAG: carbohydrate ABC transporter permease [Caldilineaceae bacterium SB0662_bin_9]|uniref:Carbohydrate ABC transporter permease n=1 Tax=Caldilineaceae bacterium SB0662_bin_9 TaxID=2605258 RepID=A0A6B1DWH4_9CHLR|nr:carbohydrate ABC transporter permease [Caldilineaceae bacterium SB0662_bin_9]